MAYWWSIAVVVSCVPCQALKGHWEFLVSSLCYFFQPQTKSRCDLGESVPQFAKTTAAALACPCCSYFMNEFMANLISMGRPVAVISGQVRHLGLHQIWLGYKFINPRPGCFQAVCVIRQSSYFWCDEPVHSYEKYYVRLMSNSRKKLENSISSVSHRVDLSAVACWRDSKRVETTVHVCQDIRTTNCLSFLVKKPLGCY